MQPKQEVFDLKQAERGFAAAAVLFSSGGGWDFSRNKFDAPRATDLQEEINPP